MQRARRRKLVNDLALKIRRTRPDVRSVILFGSVARGDDLSDSDVDLTVIAKRGPWEPQRFVLGGVLFNVYWKSWQSMLRDMLELRGDATRHGFLDGVALYDPEGLLPKLRKLVASLPESFVRASATEALHEMYEYVCKVRNAWRSRDRANLEYAARITATHATTVVALLNHRYYASENAVWAGWRAFPDLPPGFSALVPRVFKGRLPNRRLYETAMATWDTTRAWAAQRGVRLRVVRTLRAVRVPKTT